MPWATSSGAAGARRACRSARHRRESLPLWPRPRRPVLRQSAARHVVERQSSPLVAAQMLPRIDREPHGMALCPCRLCPDCSTALAPLPPTARPDPARRRVTSSGNTWDRPAPVPDQRPSAPCLRASRWRQRREASRCLVSYADACMFRARVAHRGRRPCSSCKTAESGRIVGRRRCPCPRATSINAVSRAVPLSPHPTSTLRSAAKPWGALRGQNAETRSGGVPTPRLSGSCRRPSRCQLHGPPGRAPAGPFDAPQHNEARSGQAVQHALASRWLCCPSGWRLPRRLARMLVSDS